MIEENKDYEDLEPSIDSDMIKISVGAREYRVSIAKTDKEREEGLQGVTTLPYNEGMLFVFDKPVQADFWMKDTYIPLDIIYITEDGEVTQVFADCAPFDEEHLTADSADVMYVLEVNSDSGILVGDEVDLGDLWEDGEDNEDDDNDGDGASPKMLVLNAKGGTQMELQGGERIFSRPNTKTLVRLSKRAYESKDDKDYKALGRRVFKYLDIQNNKEDDYVELPSRKD